MVKIKLKNAAHFSLWKNNKRVVISINKKIIQGSRFKWNHKGYNKGYILQ